MIRPIQDDLDEITDAIVSNCKRAVGNMAWAKLERGARMKKNAVERALDTLKAKEARTLKGLLKIQKVFESLPTDDIRMSVVDSLLDAEILVDRAVRDLTDPPKKHGGKR